MSNTEQTKDVELTAAPTEAIIESGISVESSSSFILKREGYWAEIDLLPRLLSNTVK